MYFRALDSYLPNPPPSAAAVHEFLFQFESTPPGAPPALTLLALAGQEAVARFLASDGQVTIDPDGGGSLFETPIAGPLPGEPPS
jgi:hypothetical protein